jgi:hypothetical protein
MHHERLTLTGKASIRAVGGADGKPTGKRFSMLAY